MRCFKFYLIVFIFSIVSHNIFAKIWINEFMQSNIDEIIDDLNDFPDSWVELYNDSDVDVNIQNWYISDNEDYTKGWKIPTSASIPAKGYLLIYCDRVGQGLHANFRLESGKNGAIYLFNSSKQIEDQIIEIPKQPAPNVAQGRIEDGSDARNYFIQATPGKTNNIANNTAMTVFPNPEFSIKGGIMKSFSIKLTLSLPDGYSSGIIYYTEDGSEPTIGSPTTKIYTNEITIGDATQQQKTKAVIIKAKVIAPDYLINRAFTQTYIFSGKDRNGIGFTLPIVSLSLDREYLFDDYLGIYTVGKNGITGNCQSNPVNFNQNWRRPVNVEYFSEDGSCVINQLGEMRISGGCSRGNPQKSLLVYAHKRFGENRFDYHVFKEKPYHDLKSFMIRNSGNDFGNRHMLDAAIQHFMGGKVDLDYQGYQPAILFINGEYYGIENLRERSTEDYVYSNYNGLEDIDLYEVSDKTNPKTLLKTGDEIAYAQLSEYIKRPTEQLTYEQLASYVDIKEFINYNILQIYVANTDYPQNNIVFWRPKTPDGKWRYIVKDTDFGLDQGRLAHKSIAYNTEQRDETRLFRRLLDKSQFKNAFIEHLAIYMGDILAPKSTKQIVDSMSQIIEKEVPLHRTQWGMGSFDTWKKSINSMSTWCASRNNYLYSEMNSHFGLKGIVDMKLEVPEEITGTSLVTINDVPLSKPDFNGKYFKDRNLHIEWQGDESSPFAGWFVTTYSLLEVNTTYLFGKEIDYKIPSDATEVTFVAVEDTTAYNNIQNVITDNIRIFADHENVTISGLNSQSIIQLCDISGRLLSEIKTTSQTVALPVKNSGIYLVRIISQNKTTTKKIVI